MVRGGIDPPTSGFSYPYQLFRYIPRGVSTSQNQDFVEPTDTHRDPLRRYLGT